MGYDPAKIEPKWQSYWEERKLFRAEDFSSKPKYYVLDMFPYPSGAGLHVGHPEGYTATDVLSRWKRMCGFNVLHPMGWDAFGLPAERAAVREGIHPAIITKRNVDNFRRQIKRLGFSYDWDREISTASVDYYKWTQWIFLKLHERGLAYRAEIPVNWCPAQGTVLANEEVKDGRYVETGDPVERRLMKQWMLKITAYAERLLADLDEVDWPEAVKAMQREWIGKSRGGEIRFAVEGREETITVFTTRPDTLYGAAFMVLAPEHPLVARITTPAQESAVREYVAAAAKKSDRERTGAEEKEVSGCFTGAYARHPFTGAALPVWIADYVLASYGHGAIMAVPGHDDRDHRFATKYALPILRVVKPAKGEAEPALPYAEDGVACGSGPYDGLATEECKNAIVAELEKRGIGKGMTTYRLRDWLFSRQRYWGEPFPVVIDENDQAVPLPPDALPVDLPALDDFRPAPDGRPPLARATEWMKTTTPDGRRAERETNTMPQWAGSCWYYLRYLDPRNDAAAWDSAKEKYWMPVDLYVGGVEHAVLHLLYARFWHKVLFDCGLVSTKEPFRKLFNQGMILAYSYQDAAGKYYGPEQVEQVEGAWRTKVGAVPVKTQIEKMSKSRLNVVNPDDVVAEYGADSLRLYELFMGPLDAVKPWQMNGVEGVYRFLQRAHRLVLEGDDDALSPDLADVPASPELTKLLHRTTAKVTRDLETMSFNTAISALMILLNELLPTRPRPRAAVETFVLLLSPFAPHLAEELWARLGHAESLAYAPWPTFDFAQLVDDVVELPVCINGKVKERIEVAKDADAAAVEAVVRAHERVLKLLQGKPIKKVIFVPGKMVNLVV
jgi:leucyl-tRNA synthetase